MIDVVRSSPPPEAKRALERGDFAHPDVKEHLHREFLYKCYLCEEELRLRDMQAEHIHPKNDRAWPEHKFEWLNLAAAHGGCNQVRIQKDKRTPWLVPGGWKGEAGVEARLIQKMHPEKEAPIFKAVEPGDVAAQNTAMDLEHLFNGATNVCAERRLALWARIKRVDQALHQLQDAATCGDLVRVERMKKRLRLYLSRSSPFTALARSRVPPEYHDLFDHPTDHAPK